MHKSYEYLISLVRMRHFPVLGDLVSIPPIVLGVVGESEWHKLLGIAGTILLILTRVLKIAADLNGLGHSLRAHNNEQDSQLEDHEKRIRALENVAGTRGNKP